jgi:hypothetical protein
MGLAPFVSKRGHRYYVFFIDDFSRFTWIYFLETRAQLLTAYQTFATMVRTQYDSAICIFHANSGGEYLSRSLRRFFLRKALFLSTHAPVLTLITVLLSVSIVTFLRPLKLCCLAPRFLLDSGLKPSLLIFIL